MHVVTGELSVTRWVAKTCEWPGSNTVVVFWLSTWWEVYEEWGDVSRISEEREVI